MLAWELLGAVVGAGFASGREVASFFAQYGAWGFAGIALAAAVLFFLADGVPAQWQGRAAGKVWQVLLTLLIVATGGAMLSGAGHIAALTAPVRHAAWLGTAATLLLAWWLARRTATGLMWVSRAMLAAMLGLIAAGLTLPPSRAVHIVPVQPGMALLRGAAYGGFNAALQSPLLVACLLPEKKRRRGRMAASGMIALLLALGCSVLLRHPALMGESMPFVQLTACLGKLGYGLSALCLYLAILSTLVACLRSVRGTLPVLGMLAVCCLGFEEAVDRVYPLLGGACCMMLLGGKITKIRNSLR